MTYRSTLAVSLETLSPDERAALQKQVDADRVAAELRKAAKPKRQQPEMNECFFLAGWLDRVGVLYLHIANEGLRSRREGHMLKRMGLRPGAADYLILNTPPLRPELKGVCVELKKKGSKGPEPDQVQFLLDAAKEGYGGFWIETGLSASEKLKEEYGYGSRR